MTSVDNFDFSDAARDGLLSALANLELSVDAFCQEEGLNAHSAQVLLNGGFSSTDEAIQLLFILGQKIKAKYRSNWGPKYNEYITLAAEDIRRSEAN